jgi:microcystin-dependent protein
MSQPFIGEIRMFGGNFAPVGWAFCQGQLLPIAQNQALFQLIGTTYGGDGINTFALPDLQGRVPVHQGQGLVIGGNGGTETVTLTTSQIPAHSHVPQCSSNAGNQASPAGGVWAVSQSNIYSNVAPGTAMAAAAAASTGGSQPHDNMIPFLVVNFILSLFGVFPSQN